MIDARFFGGPWDKQVRPVPEGGARIPVGDGAYHCDVGRSSASGKGYLWFAPVERRPARVTVEAPWPAALRGLVELALDHRDPGDAQEARTWIRRVLGSDTMARAERLRAVEVGRSVAAAIALESETPAAERHIQQLTGRQFDARFYGGPWAGQIRSVPYVDTLIVPGHARRDDGVYRKLGAIHRQGDLRVTGIVFRWEKP